MTPEQIAAVKQALEALYLANTRQWPENKIGSAINRLQYILADQALDKMAENEHELGIQMQPAAWVGLTDEEIDEWTPEIHSVIRSIEAKLKEKNGGNT